MSDVVGGFRLQTQLQRLPCGAQAGAAGLSFVRLVAILVLLCVPRISVANAAVVSVTISSEPSSANIEWNGQFLGTTPFATQVQEWAVKPPHFLWSKYLAEPIVLRVWKEGWRPKIVNLTSGPFVWRNLNNTATKIYYIVNTTSVNVVLEREEPLPMPPAAPSTTAPPTAAPVDVDADTVGTGFLIGNNIATNYHVVKGASRVELRFDGHRVGSASVVLRDATNDLAVLQPDPAINAESPIAFADSSRVKVGQDVFTLGYPLGDLMGDSVRLSTGSIDSLFGIGDDPRVYQISNPVQPGNSGGPLFNAQGQLVGVVVSQLDAKILYEAAGIIPQNVNFAVKGSLLKNLLEALPQGWTEPIAPPALKSAPREKQIDLFRPFVYEIVSHRGEPEIVTVKSDSEQSTRQRDRDTKWTGSIEGFSPDQVRNALGEPSLIDNAQPQIVWYYDGPSGTRKIYFVDGRATENPSASAHGRSSGFLQIPFDGGRATFDTTLKGTSAVIGRVRTGVEIEFVGTTEMRIELERAGADWIGRTDSAPQCTAAAMWRLHETGSAMLLEETCLDNGSINGGRGITLMLTQRRQ